MTKILNVTGHSIDLDDGRVLAPGEEADVKAGNRHNKALIQQGHALVVGEKTLGDDGDPTEDSDGPEIREDNKS